MFIGAKHFISSGTLSSLADRYAISRLEAAKDEHRCEKLAVPASTSTTSTFDPTFSQIQDGSSSESA